MRRLAGAVTALLMAGACASPTYPTSAPPAAARPAVAAPPPRSPVPPAAGPAKESCAAEELRPYIGRPRTDLPAPVYPDKERVACTTCPITQDFRPDRVNVFFDAETGLVKEVRCG